MSRSYIFVPNVHRSSVKPSHRLHALNNDGLLHQLLLVERLVHGLKLGQLGVVVIRCLIGISCSKSQRVFNPEDMEK